MTVAQDYCKKLHVLPQTFLINLILNINSVSDPDRISFWILNGLQPSKLLFRPMSRLTEASKLAKYAINN